MRTKWFDDVAAEILRGYEEKWSDIKPEVEAITQRVMSEFPAFFKEPVPPNQESGFFGLGFSYGPIKLTYVGTQPPKEIERYVNFKKEYPNRALVLFGSVTVAIIDQG